MLDLRKPHGANVAQGIGISQREAQHHNIRPTEKDKNVVYLIFLCVHMNLGLWAGFCLVYVSF